jgi:hypothetical protein
MLFRLAGFPAYSFSINEIPLQPNCQQCTVICSNGTTDILLQSTVPVQPRLDSIKQPCGYMDSRKGTGSRQRCYRNNDCPESSAYRISACHGYLHDNSAGPASTFCPGPAVTRTVVVNPTAELNDPADQTRCNVQPQRQ